MWKKYSGKYLLKAALKLIYTVNLTSGLVNVTSRSNKYADVSTCCSLFISLIKKHFLLNRFFQTDSKKVFTHESQ